jgi:hypothetical protein
MAITPKTNKRPPKAAISNAKQAVDAAVDAAAQNAPAVPAGKLDILIGLLRRPTGATLAEMMEATGWQGHSVRGAMAGAIKKKRGLTITSSKDSGGRTWRITGASS